MTSTTPAPSRFTLERRLAGDLAAESLRADALKGLTAQPKTLPPKYFYDARGSVLFEEITRLPEYYPTRAERQVLRRRAVTVARLTGARTLVELGSGASEKTRLLLDALRRQGTLVCYAPQDVDPTALVAAGRRLVADYPGLRVAATVADLEVELAVPDGPRPRLVAFLGGTLGNLDAEQRTAFYRAVRAVLDATDALLLGVDLVKDPRVLVRAYDDAAGVTAEFDRNLLRVLNRELDARFDPASFEHRALWNPAEERVEMRLRSRRAQRVPLGALELEVEFEAGEELRTEISVKFRRERLEAELACNGLTVERWWTDHGDRFAVLLVRPE